jgi:hypothetical protein
MFRDPCEPRVFGDQWVWREGGGSCVTETVSCWPARVYGVCEKVWQQCAAVLLSVWAAGTVRSLLSKSELQNVIGTVHVRTAKRHGTVQAIDM